MTSGFYQPTDSSSVSVQPTPIPVGPTPGYFAEGSLSSQSTIVSNDFLNGVINEFLNLATQGGIPLSPSTPTMVANILALIAQAGANFVKKTGDTMSGNLTLGQNLGVSATPALVVENGASQLNVVVNAPVATANPTTQAGDTLVWYSDGSNNTGALTIAPLGTGTTGGLRFDSTGAATFNRPLTLTNGGTVSGGNLTVQNTLTVLTSAVVPTRTVGDNSTNVATTAFVINQAGTAIPIVNGVATVGTSTSFARQDHVHATDPTRQAVLGFTPVQQGGGTGMGTNKVFLGFDGQSVSLQVDATPFGPIGMLSSNQNWGGANTFSQGITTGGPIQSTGNILAFNGYLRASNGVFANQADPNIAPYQFDFGLHPGAGFMQWPAWDADAGVGIGYIQQWMHFNIGPGAGQVVTIPVQFPHAFFSVNISFGYLLPAGGVVGCDIANAAQIFVSNMTNSVFGVYLQMVGC